LRQSFLVVHVRDLPFLSLIQKPQLSQEVESLFGRTVGNILERDPSVIPGTIDSGEELPKIDISRTRLMPARYVSNLDVGNVFADIRDDRERIFPHLQRMIHVVLKSDIGLVKLFDQVGGGAG